MELAHGLLSVASKDTTQRQSQSQDLSDSGTTRYCEGAEQRGNKEISGKMIHRFWRSGEESKTAVFPDVLK